MYFSFYIPEAGDNGKFEKHIVPTYGMNREFPNFNDRYRATHKLLKATEQMLEDGFNPLDVQIIVEEVFTMEKVLDLSLSNKKTKVAALKTDTQTFNCRLLRDFLNKVAKESSVANKITKEKKHFRFL